jgi:1-acyl-sn-glycerol-3-phosphate acyltransferase
VLYKFLQEFLVRPFCLLFFGARIEGAHNVPKKGAGIIVANHQSGGETIILPGLIHRKMSFLAKAELFQGGRGFVSELLAWIMPRIDMVPLNRAGGRDTLAALSHAVDNLESGGLMAMFPEGTRSPDARLYKGKTGAARLALATGAPVIPVGLFNTRSRKLPLGLRWYVKPRVVVGEPIRFDEYLGQSEDRAVVRHVTDEIMAAIQQITGQEYVDLYASSVKYGGLTPAEVQARILPRPGAGRAVPPTDAAIEEALDPPSEEPHGEP